MTDGPDQQFRCFSASQEAAFKSVRKSRWNNYKRLLKAKTVEGMRDLILASLKPEARTVRVHVAGDFFSQVYFDAWLDVARHRPETLFYAYTKSIPLWQRREDVVPANFILTGSHGGKWDALLKARGYKSVKVVYDKTDHADLPRDKSDELARIPSLDFALYIHGGQPTGSRAAAALKKLKEEGLVGYAKSV